MGNLWWLEPGWTETLCADCGCEIWPEGDPDHGICHDCYFRRYEACLEEQTADETGEFEEV